MMATGAGRGVHPAEGPPPLMWLDVAPLLQRAAAAMEPGRLLHGETFSLFESVSAVEIGGAPHPVLPVSSPSPRGAMTALALLERHCSSRRIHSVCSSTLRRFDASIAWPVVGWGLTLSLHRLELLDLRLFLTSRSLAGICGTSAHMQLLHAPELAAMPLRASLAGRWAAARHRDSGHLISRRRCSRGGTDANEARP